MLLFHTYTVREWHALAGTLDPSIRPYTLARAANLAQPAQLVRQAREQQEVAGARGAGHAPAHQHRARAARLCATRRGRARRQRRHLALHALRLRLGFSKPLHPPCLAASHWGQYTLTLPPCSPKVSHLNLALAAYNT